MDCWLAGENPPPNHLLSNAPRSDSFLADWLISKLWKISCRVVVSGVESPISHPIGIINLWHLWHNHRHSIDMAARQITKYAATFRAVAVAVAAALSSDLWLACVISLSTWQWQWQWQCQHPPFPFPLTRSLSRRGIVMAMMTPNAGGGKHYLIAENANCRSH